MKWSRILVFGTAVSLAGALAYADGISSQNEHPESDRRLYVLNGAGEPIGLYAGLAGAAGGSDPFPYRVYLERIGVSILVDPFSGELIHLGRSFTSEDCQGQGLYSAASAGIVSRDFDPADTTLYLASPDVLIVSAEIQSHTRSFGGFCGNNAPESSTNLVPAVPFRGELGVDLPLRLPLSIGTLSPQR